VLNIKTNQPKLVHVWIYTGNKSAKFHGNILSLSENIAKKFKGGYFFDSLYIRKGEGLGVQNVWHASVYMANI